MTTLLCPTCRGAGSFYGASCGNCRGRGVVAYVFSEDERVKIVMEGLPEQRGTILTRYFGTDKYLVLLDEEYREPPGEFSHDDGLRDVQYDHLEPLIREV